METNLMQAYAEVFDENGAVKNCGRAKTIQLITLCAEVGCVGVDFGSTTTGMMNITNIQQLISTLESEV